MSTSTFELLNYFCPHTSNVPVQTIQKKFNHSQFISYQKELKGNRKQAGIQKSKLSLSYLKKQKLKEKGKNTTLMSQNQVLSQKQQLMNIQIDNNFYCNKSFDCNRTQRNNISRIQPYYQKDISQSCRSVYDNKIITRKLNLFQNNNQIVANNALCNFKQKMFIQNRNQNEVQKFNFIQPIIFTQKITQANNQHQKLFSQMIVKQQSGPVINSGQLTLSTNHSKQNIIINQQQSFRNEPTLQITHMKSPIFIKKQLKFPEGFRHAQSLEDNESLAHDLSIVLDNLTKNQNKQAKTERKQQKNLRISNLSERQPYLKLDITFQKEQAVQV